jgi:hypothetical protein
VLGSGSPRRPTPSRATPRVLFTLATTPPTGPYVSLGPVAVRPTRLRSRGAKLGPRGRRVHRGSRARRVRPVLQALRAKRVRPGRPALRASQVPVGPAGPPGAAGAQPPVDPPGTPGPSHAFSTSSGAIGTTGGWLASPTTVNRLTVPAGAYLVWATGQANQVVGSDNYARCALSGSAPSQPKR